MGKELKIKSDLCIWRNWGRRYRPCDVAAGGMLFSVMPEWHTDTMTCNCVLYIRIFCVCAHSRIPIKSHCTVTCYGGTLLVLCTALLLCICKVQFWSWQQPVQSCEHAVWLCTIPLFLHNIIECCNVNCGAFLLYSFLIENVYCESRHFHRTIEAVL